MSLNQVLKFHILFKKKEKRRRRKCVLKAPKESEIEDA